MSEATETMQTGDIQRRIGILGVTEQLLIDLGFKSVDKNKRAVLWDQADYPAMCEAVGNYIKARATMPMQPKPERVRKEKPAADAGAAPTTKQPNAAAPPPAADQFEEI